MNNAILNANLASNYPSQSNLINNTSEVNKLNVTGKNNKKMRTASITSDISVTKSPNKEILKSNNIKIIPPSLAINKNNINVNKEMTDNISSLIKKRDDIVNKLNSLKDGNNIFDRKAPPVVIPRLKTHWDYVLDEVAWMAIDYRQELR